MMKLTQFIKDDMHPAFGVTEPGAIAYGTAYACNKCRGELISVEVRLNSGMYKNAYSCGIPNIKEYGSVYAAALGAALKENKEAIDSKLEILQNVTEEERKLAYDFVDRKIIRITNCRFSSDIYIQISAKTEEDECTVIISHTHTNIVKIIKNGCILFEKKDMIDSEESIDIHSFSIRDIWDYIHEVSTEELQFIEDAYNVNLQLVHASIASKRTVYAGKLFQKNGDKLISSDELATAQLLCSGAIEGRVLGLNTAAMSITGSGSHGLICTMPLYAVSIIRGISRNQLLRATALSYLITIYIKEYSGRLSAFCGCGIAAGTGMACGLAYLSGGDYATLFRTINNMASGITGMICHGGNHGCTLKSITAVDAAFRAVDFALDGIGMEDIHGICGKTPEDTCRNMGLIASPGMVECEKTILKIMENK